MLGNVGSWVCSIQKVGVGSREIGDFPALTPGVLAANLGLLWACSGAESAPSGSQIRQPEPVLLVILALLCASVLVFCLQHRAITSLQRQTDRVFQEISQNAANRLVPEIRRSFSSRAKPHDPRYIVTVHGSGYRFVV